MKNNNRHDDLLKHVVFITILIGLAITLRLMFPMHISDDAYITLRGACNLIAGEGLVVNQGENVFAITTPLWGFIIAGLHALGLSLKNVLFTLGLFFEAATAIIIYFLGNRIFKNTGAGFIAGVLLLTNSAVLFTNFSGMETPLYLFVIALTFLFISKKHYAYALTTSAIAVWTRIDGLLLLGVIVIAYFLKVKKKKITDLVLPAIMTIGYFVFALLQYGDLLPTSLTAKLGEGGMSLLHAPALVWHFIEPIFGLQHYWYIYLHYTIIALIPLGIIGLYVTWRYKSNRNLNTVTIMGIYFLLYAGAFVLSGKIYAANFPWYFVPPLLIIYLFIGGGIAIVFHKLLRRKETIGIIILAVLIFYTALNPLTLNDTRLTWMEADREQSYASTSIFLTDKLGGDGTLAATEIGAVSFFAPAETEIIDLIGLTRIKEDRDKKYPQIVDEHKPDVIISRWEGDKYMVNISTNRPDMYAWTMYKTINIGVRRDLVTVVGNTSEIEKIYLANPLTTLACSN